MKAITLQQATDEITRLQRLLKEADQSYAKQVAMTARVVLEKEAAEDGAANLETMWEKAEAEAQREKHRADVLHDANQGWKRREDLIAADNRRLRAALEACDVVMDTAGILGISQQLPEVYRDSWAMAHMNARAALGLARVPRAALGRRHDELVEEYNETDNSALLEQIAILEALLLGGAPAEAPTEPAGKGELTNECNR